jgi:predicted ABC-type ATPase
MVPEKLPNILNCYEYVNADAIAHALSPFKQENVAIEAGRIMLKRIREIAKKQESFAFETTMASRSFVHFLSKCKSNGYGIHLIYIWLQSPELSIARVAKRVQAGGHSVPTDVIRKRYNRGFENFFKLYLPMADSWSFYDNSKSTPLLFAEKIVGNHLNIQTPID